MGFRALRDQIFKIYAKPYQMQDLPIIQKTYYLIKWYVPILNHLPRDHKFQLGDRLISGLYDLLENLIFVRYQREKLPLLELPLLR